jgi:hypothetical protein
MDFSAPFICNYWPYLAALILGVITTEFIRFISSPKPLNYTVDVDPLQDTDEASDLPRDPLDVHITGDSQAPMIPYPFFDEIPSEDEMKKKAREFFEHMNKRRTVRNISSDPVPLDVIENIVRTAGLQIRPSSNVASHMCRI